MNVNDLIECREITSKLLRTKFKKVSVNEIKIGDIIVYSLSQYNFKTQKIGFIKKYVAIDGDNLIRFYGLNNSPIVQRLTTKKAYIKLNI